MRRRFINFAVLISLGTAVMVMAPATATFGKNPPVWWPRVQEEARESGYALITPEDLKDLINDGEELLLLDVRPDYEFRSGHLPKALNLEFHLGDRLQIGPEKKSAFQKILGPEKDRRVVIYCRSFR